MLNNLAQNYIIKGPACSIISPKDAEGYAIRIRTTLGFTGAVVTYDKHANCAVQLRLLQIYPKMNIRTKRIENFEILTECWFVDNDTHKIAIHKQPRLSWIVIFYLALARVLSPSTLFILDFFISFSIYYSSTTAFNDLLSLPVYNLRLSYFVAIGLL